MRNGERSPLFQAESPSQVATGIASLDAGPGGSGGLGAWFPQGNGPAAGSRRAGEGRRRSVRPRRARGRIEDGVFEKAHLRNPGEGCAGGWEFPAQSIGALGAEGGAWEKSWANSAVSEAGAAGRRCFQRRVPCASCRARAWPPPGALRFFERALRASGMGFQGPVMLAADSVPEQSAAAFGSAPLNRTGDFQI